MSVSAPHPTLRRAVPSDAAAIAAHNRAMAADTEGVELDPGRLAAGVAAALADPSKGFYLLAERDGRVVGQLLVTSEWSDWRDGTFWWIQSVYVLPDARRQGVYRALYAHVLETARAAPDVCGVRLYVHHDNAAAAATYAALGMARAPYEVFEVDFVIAR